MFHVSQLKKCLWVPDEAVEIEGLPLQPDLTYIEHPVKILDEKERVTRNNVVKFYKVWQNLLRNWAHVHLSMSQQTSDSVHKFPTT